MALAGSNGRSRSQSSNAASYPYLAICVGNAGNEGSLQLGKAYKVIEPLRGDPAGRLRVVDEEGEDYLYLKEWFVPIAIAADAERRVMAVLTAAG